MDVITYPHPNLIDYIPTPLSTKSYVYVSCTSVHLLEKMGVF